MEIETFVSTIVGPNYHGQKVKTDVKISYWLLFTKKIVKCRERKKEGTKKRRFSQNWKREIK